MIWVNVGWMVEMFAGEREEESEYKVPDGETCIEKVFCKNKKIPAKKK